MNNSTIADNELVINTNNCTYDEKNCAVMAAMELIGGKWKVLLITRIYFDSPARFGVLMRCLKGISQSMLTSQLRELERDGIICRKIYAEIPPKVEYTLTEFGLTLHPIITAMAEWGHKYRLNT